MGTWKTNGLPKSKESEVSDEVLVTWIPNWNKNVRLVGTAVYIEFHNVTTDDMNWKGDFKELDYNEQDDVWYIPCGWYESIQNSIEDVCYVPFDGTIIAWQKMIKAYHEPIIDLSKLN